MIARSLTARLTLAFLFTGLASVALVGLFARTFAGADFDRFLRERERDAYVAAAASYYEANGVWEGVERALPRYGPTNGSGPRPGGSPFALADQRGILLTRGGPLRPGAALSPALLANGAPVEVGGVRVGTVVDLGVTPARNERANEFLQRIDRTLLYASIGGAALALVIGIVLARFLTRPLQALTEAIGAMRRGAPAPEVRVTTQDEIGQLVRAFNEMSADLARANAARRRMTADIAHELNTPLSVISGYMEGMRDGVLDPTPERFETMYDETRRLQRLIGDLRLLSLADAGELRLQREPIAPRRLLDAVAAAYQPHAAQQQIAIEVEAADTLPAINVDRERMLQVFANIMSNALRHTPAGGRISLTAVQHGGEVQFTVADTGNGIAPEALPHIFERLYRADASRQIHDGGSGLGLSIARAIVELHGGSIAAQSAPSVGTTISMTLPVAAGETGRVVTTPG
jgi:signal transduction histidine kinase